VKIDLLGESESCKQFRSAECGVVRQMGSSDPAANVGAGTLGWDGHSPQPREWLLLRAAFIVAPAAAKGS